MPVYSALAFLIFDYCYDEVYNIYMNVKKLTLSALFLAAGMVLPFLTGQIKEIGNMLLPMHFPVFLCSLICGAPYGFIVGLILPTFRSVCFGMPPIFPQSICMDIELATYGLVSGFLYDRSKYKCIISLYKALIPAMILGRVMWGLVSIILYGIAGKPFTFAIFFGGALLNSLPGIILQLILIPIIMLAFGKTKLVKFNFT